MGHLRSAAKCLAQFTERHIPDPARRWASAIAHELDYVEGDWHSLIWALGGLRLLFLRGFVPNPTPARLERLAALHGRLRRVTAQRSLASRLAMRANMFLNLVLFLYLLHHMYPAHAFPVLGLTSYCAGSCFLLVNGLRPRTGVIPEEENTQALLALYRADLRQSTQVSSLLGFILPALLTFAGTELLAPILWVRLLGSFWLVMVLLFLQKYRVNRVALDALNAGI